MEDQLSNPSGHTQQANDAGHPSHRFQNIDRLRSPERLARLEVERVVDLALEGAALHGFLDIGTGTGIFAEAFHNRALVVTGIDVNPEMLKAAQHYVPDGIFQPAEAENLPFPDQSFDLNFMGLVLHETDDPQKALQEASRVTRNRLVILEWPYQEQDFGPGLEERLPDTQVMSLANQAGFGQGKKYSLQTLVLYLFEKSPRHEAL